MDDRWDVNKQEINNESEKAVIEEINKEATPERQADSFTRQQETQNAAAGGQRQEYTANKQFYNESVKEKKKNHTFGKVIAACLVVSIAGGGSIGAGYALTQNVFQQFAARGTEIAAERKESLTEKKANTDTALSIASSSGSSDSNAAVGIIKEVFPSVVSINMKVQGETEYFGGFLVPYEGEGAGSGVIFSEDEEKVYIVTNYHVVNGATEITISIDEEVNIPAKIVSKDNASELAVISVLKSDLEAAGISQITVANFGDSDDLEIGESVIAIGNALGQGKTATGGMISAINKSISVDGKTLNVIQLDAPINKGNSGGALVNYNGEVVGINTAKSGVATSEGVGYAIPSNAIKPVVEKLLEEGKYGKPYLGIVGESITGELADLYGLPVGVLVRQTVDGGSAAEAGILPGDIIIDFAGEKIMDMDKLVEVLAKQKVGANVEVKVIRDGKTSVTLHAVIQDANNQ